MNDSITSGGTHVVSAETLFDLADGTLRHLPQSAEYTLEDVQFAARMGYKLGYDAAMRDAVQVVKAEVAHWDAVRAAGRGE